MNIGLTRKFYPLADPQNFTVRPGNSPVSSAMMQVLDHADSSRLDQVIARRPFHLTGSTGGETSVRPPGRMFKWLR